MSTQYTRGQRLQFDLRMEQEYSHQHPLREVGIFDKAKRFTYTDDGVETWYAELDAREARGESYEQAEAWILHRIRELETRPQEPGGTDPHPGPGPAPGPSPLGQLEIAGVNFIEDGHIWKMRGIVAFTAFQDWLDGRRDQLDTFAAWTRRQHGNTWRIFCQWRVTNFDPRAYGDAFYDGVANCRAWMLSQGIRPLPVFFCDQASGPIVMSAAEQDRHFDRLAQIFETDLKTFVNEDWQNGGLAHRFRVLPLASRSAYQDGAAPTEPGTLMGWTEQQFARKWDWARGGKNVYETARSGLGNIAAATGKPASGPEPPLGINEADIAWSRTTDARATADFMGTLELMGAGGCLHGDRSNLQSCLVPGPRAQACADAVTAMWTAGLPADACANGQYTRGGLGDCPLQHSDRFDDGGREIDAAGALRTFFLIQGGRATGIVIQPGRDWQPRGDHGWTVAGQRGPQNQIIECTR